jgi:hypothetical protein
MGTFISHPMTQALRPCVRVDDLRFSLKEA